MTGIPAQAESFRWLELPPTAVPQRFILHSIISPPCNNLETSNLFNRMKIFFGWNLEHEKGKQLKTKTKQKKHEAKKTEERDQRSDSVLRGPKKRRQQQRRGRKWYIKW